MAGSPQVSLNKIFGDDFAGLTETNSSGLFALGGELVDFGVSTASQVKITSISFDANQFDLSITASSAIVRLDWANGPASRAADQTITGAWTFTSIFCAGLTSCSNTTTSKLLWNSATGQFSCGIDQTTGFSGGGTQIDVGTDNPDGNRVSSVSFHGAAFNLDISNGYLAQT
jgi:hypothetical protein